MYISTCRSFILYCFRLLHEISKIKDFITHKFYLLYITCTKYAYLQENQNMTRLKIYFLHWLLIRLYYCNLAIARTFGVPRLSHILLYNFSWLFWKYKKKFKYFKVLLDTTKGNIKTILQFSCGIFSILSMHNKILGDANYLLIT